MPELPRNAKYLHHANECYDWGTFGWALKQENVQVSDYKYFIFLNSSVRGPFLPPYLQVHRATAPLYARPAAGSPVPEGACGAGQDALQRADDGHDQPGRRAQLH